MGFRDRFWTPTTARAIVSWRLLLGAGVDDEAGDDGPDHGHAEDAEDGPDADTEQEAPRDDGLRRRRRPEPITEAHRP